jgi:MIT (microtubule interacting and transport) domain
VPDKWHVSAGWLVPDGKETEQILPLPFPCTMDAKALLRSALQKAHVAVLADQEKNNAAALEAYTEALLLLDQVLISVDRDEDKMRIQQIVSA